MYCNNINQTYLMINTEIDFEIFAIDYDNEFFEYYLPKIAKFYFCCLLPELHLKNRSKNRDILDLRQFDIEKITCLKDYLYECCPLLAKNII